MFENFGAKRNETKILSFFDTDHQNSISFRYFFAINIERHMMSEKLRDTKFWDSYYKTIVYESKLSKRSLKKYLIDFVIFLSFQIITAR